MQYQEQMRYEFSFGTGAVQLYGSSVYPDGKEELLCGEFTKLCCAHLSPCNEQLLRRKVHRDQRISDICSRKSVCPLPVKYLT